MISPLAAFLIHPLGTSASLLSNLMKLVLANLEIKADSLEIISEALVDVEVTNVSGYILGDKFN